MIKVELHDGSVVVLSVRELIDNRNQVAFLLLDDDVSPGVRDSIPRVGKIPVDDLSRDALIPLHVPRRESEGRTRGR